MFQGLPKFPVRFMIVCYWLMVIGALTVIGAVLGGVVWFVWWLCSHLVWIG